MKNKDNLLKLLAKAMLRTETEWLMETDKHRRKYLKDLQNYLYHAIMYERMFFSKENNIYNNITKDKKDDKSQGEQDV